jgi:[protein-PII] uridylyltransferase
MPLLTPDESAARLRKRSSETDAQVIEAWQSQLSSALPAASVLAVGGFGRRELFPYSDVDVLVLVPDSLDLESSRSPVGAFIQQIWDAGLRLSHSVRNVSECLALHDGNFELTTSLLDRRFLCGSAGAWSDMERGWAQFMRSRGKELARNLAGLTRERHAKSHNTVFQLEPNLKESPGGLRDLHVVSWLGGLLSTAEPFDIESHMRFLAPLRMFLHERASRDQNVLDFEAQEQIGQQPAELMREYYRHARAIFAEARRRLQMAEDRNASLLDQFRDWRSRLSNADFTVSREQVYLKTPSHLETDPELTVRLFAFVGRHGLQLALDTETRLAHFFAAGKSAPPAWTGWRSILLQPHAATGLRAAHNSGALAAWIPEWRRIECLVVRDFYHRYTVDEHTLVAIDALEYVEDQRFKDLFSEIDRPDLLRFALLMHDIGKGGGNHIVISKQLASEVGTRIGLAGQDLDTVLSLIDQHLMLSTMMTSRDLTEAGTASQIAAAAGTVERLKMLTMLTYADISAVHPAAMTPWRAEQLWRAYLTGYEELTRELATQRIHAVPGANPALARFLEGFPQRYQKTHTQAEMEAHLDLANRAQAAGAAVEVKRLNGYYQATVAAADRPGLFAAFSGALAAFGFSILKAEAFSNTSGTILDTFVFADPLRTLELNPAEAERLEFMLVRVALGREDVKKLLQRRPVPRIRPGRLDPRVRFDNEASPAATLVEIVAEDRPGLLYDLASTLSRSGCNIDVVLIDTEGHKAIDVFYVTVNGQPVDSEFQVPLRRDLLEACRVPAANSSSGRAGARG